MQKSLDAKIAEIHANPDSNAFILADAKDADMAFGIAAPGRSPEHADGEFRSLAEYRQIIRDNINQGLLDIMLMSVSTNELLTIRERLFDDSPITPAIRANDTTDIHVARCSCLPAQPSQPFRSALIDHAQCGQLCTDDSQRKLGADLGLYSITFNNDVDQDTRTLENYRQFRIEAEQKNFRHFMEIFDPNAPVNPIPDEGLGGFINDLIVRTLAGVASSARPLFLKIVYHGPKFMEELAHYDHTLVAGILGGSSGTTYDAFKLLAEAKKYGARAALFGRKINNAEHQLTFIQFLRWIADGEISPEEAVEAYHGALGGMGIRPWRTLAEDMQMTTGVTSYGGSGSTISIPATVRTSAGRGPGAIKPAAVPGSYPLGADGAPDFAKMTPDERLAYHSARLDQMFS